MLGGICCTKQTGVRCKTQRDNNVYIVKQPTSPIGFPFFMLPPSPCTVLLVFSKEKPVSERYLFCFFLHLLWTFNFQIFFFMDLFVSFRISVKKEKVFSFHFFCGGSPGTHQKIGASRLFLLQEFLCEKNVTQNEDTCVIFHPTWWFCILCFYFCILQVVEPKKHQWKLTNQGSQLNKSSTTNNKFVECLRNHFFLPTQKKWTQRKSDTLKSKTKEVKEITKSTCVERWEGRKDRSAPFFSTIRGSRL